ncbi:hypothetical protein [Methanobrevibacter sp.]|uniref:DISARM anti-phage system protein DrmE domain-containing protein n=1 Tax=Methanobrevibacter sp. TaxID=66852 RepID=UPI0026E00468|nr:hypothetical protein [Methanobrevibacter sp.]MDO5824276.1 hypothetical protein [Methanobrevibacter sp.]
MVLKKWNKVINSRMGCYFPERNNDKTLEFPKNLSPLTNFSLDVFANTISEKNLIINFPDFKLGPISLFAYIFSEKFKQSIYVLANEKGDSLNSRSKISLNKNHYLLSDYGEFIFHRLPIFYLKRLNENEDNYQENPIKYKLSLEKYLPRASRKFKKEYTEKRVLNQNFFPKIIIDTDSSLHSIKNKLKIILETNDKYINPEKFPIGLIIIEDGDRFFRSFGRLENFITWFKELDKDVKLLIHFNNPPIEYVKILIKELNFAVLPFNKFILTNNDYLNENSRHYFENRGTVNLEHLSRYNLDSDIFIKENINVTIYDDIINSGSIDMFFSNAYSSFKKIDMDTVYNQNSLHKARELLFNLYNLTINPNYLKISFKFNNHWIRGNIYHFIQDFKSKLYMENHKNRFLIYDFLDSLSSMYFELSSCKRVNEDLSYSRKAKDYVLYELLEDLIKQKKEVFVGTYIDTEPTVLKQTLEKGEFSNADSVVPISMEMLIQKPDSEKVGKTLVLPGIIPEMFTSEIFKPYDEIIILSYEGRNHKYLVEQLNRLVFGNIIEEKEYMDYFNEALEPFDSEVAREILDNFYKRFNEIEFEEEKTIEETEPMESEFEESENIFNIDINFDNYMNDWTESKSNLSSDISNEIDYKHYDTISFNLQNISNNNFVEKKLPVNKSYLTFDNIYHIDDAKELKPSELKSGDYIVIIDNDEKKSLLSLVIDASDLKSKIKSDLVEYWKLEFLNFVEMNNLKYSEVFELYREEGGDKTYQTVMQWCKGELIGPQSSEDLYIIGKLIDNDFIIENYRIIFRQIALVRNSHRLIGRKLKKMIKSILTDEYLDLSSLNDSEYLIYENIQNGIYKIV